MFWTDWGPKARIERASMDGSMRTTVVTRNVGWPNGLVVDRETQSIIWTDGRRGTIEMADWDGNGRQTVLRGLDQPYGVIMMDRDLYWVDWGTRELLSMRRFNVSSKDVVLRDTLGIMDVKSVSNSLQYGMFIIAQQSQPFSLFHVTLFLSQTLLADVKSPTVAVVTFAWSTCIASLAHVQ